MKEVDERVLITRRNINAKAFGYAFFALWGIISFKMFVLHQSPKEYSDIFLLTMALSAYVLTNDIRSGVFQDSKEKSSNKVVSLFIELTSVIAFPFIFRFSKYLPG